MLREDFMGEPMGWDSPQDVCLARVFLPCWFSARMNVGPGEFLVEGSDGRSCKGEGCRKLTPTLDNNVGRSSASLRVWRNICRRCWWLCGGSMQSGLWSPQLDDGRQLQQWLPVILPSVIIPSPEGCTQWLTPNKYNTLRGMGCDLLRLGLQKTITSILLTLSLARLPFSLWWNKLPCWEMPFGEA